MGVDARKWPAVFRIVFYVGLALGVFASLNFRYAFLSDYAGGFLAGVAACFIVGGGVLGHLAKDGKARA